MIRRGFGLVLMFPFAVALMVCAMLADTNAVIFTVIDDWRKKGQP